ncbi:MAG: hypothetical protein ABIE94_06140 [archaeon]
MAKEPNVKKDFMKELKALSKQELRELVMINTYKLAMVRSQVDAIVQVLIKNKLATYEEIWKKTNESFQEHNV